MTTVLDSSALLRFVDGQIGAEQVEELLDRAQQSGKPLLMSAANWGEVVYTVLRFHGTSSGPILLSTIRTLPIDIVPVTTEGAERAADFKHTYKIAYADAFAGSLALSESATLLTADQDFRAVPKSVIKIEFLPVKPRA